MNKKMFFFSFTRKFIFISSNSAVSIYSMIRQQHKYCVRTNYKERTTFSEPVDKLRSEQKTFRLLLVLPCQ